MIIFVHEFRAGPNYKFIVLLHVNISVTIGSILHKKTKLNMFIFIPKYNEFILNLKQDNN